MKSIKLLCILGFIISLSSCTFTENIYINEDGTGKFSVDMDGSAMMALAGKEMQKDSTAKAIDSTFSFKEMFASKKDSISKLPAAEQEHLKNLENFTMGIKMIPAEQLMMFTMGTDFKNVGELEDMMSTMNKVQGLNKDMAKANPMAGAGGFGMNNSTLKYTYTGKKFTRKATINKKESADVANDSLQEGYKMIYESSTYILKYHFPKAVKKISNPNALFSDDRKTITIEYPFNEYMDDPEKLNFEIEFE